MIAIAEAFVTFTYIYQYFSEWWHFNSMLYETRWFREN